MQSYQEAVKWATTYLDMERVTIDELREEAQKVKDGTFTLKGLDENEWLNNIFYDLPSDSFASAEDFVRDVQGLGPALEEAQKFWDDKAKEMSARRSRGESPFTVEILQALGLQNKGNRLYTILCDANSDLRNNHEYWDLTDEYLGPFYARALADVYESGCLAAIHNESLEDEASVGSFADLAAGIKAAGESSRPKFGP